MYYFEKVAKMTEKQKQKEKQVDAAKYLGAAHTALIANIIDTSHLKSVLKKNSNLSDEEILNIVSDKMKETGHKDKFISTEILNDPLKSKMLNLYLMKPKLETGRNEFVLRHELGHFKDFDKRNKRLYNKGLSYDKKYEEMVSFGSYYKSKEAEYNKLSSQIADLEKSTNSSSKDKELLEELLDKKKDIGNHLDSIYNEYVQYSKKIFGGYTKLVGGKVFTDFSTKVPATALHSKTVRNYVRDKNNGRSKTVDKAMDILDNPLASTAILGTISNSSTLRDELVASLDATKDMVKKYGRKKGLAMALPGFGLQMGSYITSGLAKEGFKGAIVRSSDNLILQKQKQLEKKASYKELIYKESER